MHACSPGFIFICTVICYWCTFSDFTFYNLYQLSSIQKKSTHKKHIFVVNSHSSVLFGYKYMYWLVVTWNSPRWVYIRQKLLYVYYPQMCTIPSTVYAAAKYWTYLQMTWKLCRKKSSFSLRFMLRKVDHETWKKDFALFPLSKPITAHTEWCVYWWDA